MCMPWWADVAKKDARVRATPRGLSKFVCVDTGVCQLCGRGLGKRFSKECRKIHQTSDQHLSNFQRYSAEFDEERNRWLDELDEQRVAEVEERGRRVATDPVAHKAMMRHVLASIGVREWIDLVDSTALKAALVDFLVADDDATRRSMEAARAEHIGRARRRFSRQVAAAVLKEDPAGAYTAGVLVGAHV